jgi:hypothetical protein
MDHRNLVELLELAILLGYCTCLEIPRVLLYLMMFRDDSWGGDQ